MTIQYSDTHSSNLDLCLISFLSPHPVFDTACTTALNRSLPPRLLSICYYYCHLRTLPSFTPPTTPTFPLDSRSDLWLLILYLSSRRTGAREMTCFCLGWKETHRYSRTHTHAQRHRRLRQPYNVITGKQSTQLHTWVQLGSEPGCYSDTDGGSQELVC